MMNDYIDRQAAIEAAYQGLQRPSNSDEWKRILEHINAIPSEDVEPVKRGKWMEMGTNADGTRNIKCDQCGEGFKTRGHARSYYTKNKYKFCPNCGAKMEPISASPENGQEAEE